MQLSEFRQKYPQYNDLNDEVLTNKLHKKYYPDISYDDFSAQIGYAPVVENAGGDKLAANELTQAFTPPIELINPTFKQNANNLQSAINNPPKLPEQETIEILGESLPVNESSFGNPSAAFDKYLGDKVIDDRPMQFKGDLSLDKPLPGMSALGERSETQKILDSILGERGAPTLQDNAEGVVLNQALNVAADKNKNLKAGDTPFTAKQYIEESGAPIGALDRGIKDVGAGALGIASGSLGYMARMAESSGLLNAQALVQAEADALMPANPNFADEVLNAFGSAGGMFIPGLGIMKGLDAAKMTGTVMSRWLGAGASAGLEAGVEAGSVYSELIQNGYGHEEAARRADNVFFANAALVSVTNRYGLFNEAGSNLSRRSLAAVNEGVLQEAPQQMISNVATDKPISEGVAKSALIGSIVGGGLGGNHQTAAGRDKHAANNDVKNWAENIQQAELPQNQQALVDAFNPNNAIAIQEDKKPVQNAIPVTEKLTEKELNKNNQFNPQFSSEKQVDDSIHSISDVAATNLGQSFAPPSMPQSDDTNKSMQEVEVSSLEYNLPRGTKAGNAQDIVNLYDRVTSGKIDKNNKEAVRYSVVSNDQAIKLKEKTGFDLKGYKHTVDSFSINHTINSHGNNEVESRRGQIAITRDDIEKIPDIIHNYDDVKHAGKDDNNRDLIQYRKRYNGTTYYVEEVRAKRTELMAKTMWKMPTRDLMLDPEESPPILRPKRFDSIPPHRNTSVAQDKSKPETTPEKINDFGEKIGGARKDTSTPLGKKVATEKDSRPGWLRRYEVNEIASEQKTSSKGELFDTGNKGKFTIFDKKTSRTVRAGREHKHFDTQEDAENAIPLIEVSRNHRVQMTRNKNEGDPTYEIIRVVSERKRPVIKDGFESREDAMKYLAKNATEIIETKTRLDASIHPALEKADRKGVERRSENENVTADKFGETFGFRGVEFGKWNNREERQIILNQAYDAFLDLADMLNIPPKAVSLNGELGIGFGSRGHGLKGSRAHYERDYGAINLTKIKGAGSLAHEWMHAFDHYLGRQADKANAIKINNKQGDEVFDAKDARSDYVSHGFGYKSKDKVREELKTAFDKVMDVLNHRTQEYKEDISTREKFESARKAELIKRLDEFRKGLTVDYTNEQYPRYRGKKNNLPATKEELKKVDAVIKRIKNAEYGESKWIQAKGGYNGVSLNEPVAELSVLYKSIRGRQGYSRTSGRLHGIMIDLQAAVSSEKAAEEFLHEAREQKTKTQKVKSEFYSESWKMDRGAKADYWSTKHEMAARGFESYIYDKLKTIDARNDFLSYEKHNNLPEYRMFNLKPYPEGKERVDINEAFDKLFNVIKVKQTDKGAALFSREVKNEPASNTVKINKQANKSGLSVSDVENIIGSITSTWSNTDLEVIVLQSTNDVPPHIKDINGEGVRDNDTAIYSPDEKTIYMVADNLTTETVPIKLAHEAIGHYGIEGILGENFEPVMRQVQRIKNSGDIKVKRIAEEVLLRYGQLPKTEESAEILAVMAEKGVKHPIIAKAITKLKAFLRWLGFKVKFTAVELEALLADSSRYLHTNKKRNKKTSDDANDGFSRFSREESDAENNLSAEDKKKITARFSNEPQEVLDDIESAMVGESVTFDEWKGKAGDALDKVKVGGLGALTRQMLEDIGKKHLPGISTFVKTSQEMDATRNHMVIEGAEVVKPWEKFTRKNKEEAKKLVSLMHEATQAGVDPQIPYKEIISKKEAKERINVLSEKARMRSAEAYKFIREINEIKQIRGFEVNRAKAYPALKKQWDALHPEAKEIYINVRDYHATRFNQTEETLLARIDRAELAQSEKREAKESIRLQFENVRVQAPYFPLFRAGEYWVSGKKNGQWQEKYTIKQVDGQNKVYRKNGRTVLAIFKTIEKAQEFAQEQVMESVFYLFDGSFKQKQEASALRKEGFTVKVGVKLDSIKSTDAAGSGFVSELMTLIDTLPEAQANPLKDEVYQLYLTTLPEMSMRNHSRHRQKTPGFSHDALRGFAHQAFHGAHQLAKLQYSDILEQQLSTMRDNISELSDSSKPGRIFNELQKRHAWAMNPTGKQWVNKFTQGAFLWYLTSISAGVINTTQTPLMALPIMAAENTWSSASKALLGASADFVSGHVSVSDGVFSASASSNLTRDEKNAFQQWLDSGAIDRTLTHDLAQQSENPTELYSERWNKFVGVAGYVFHHAERFNREVTLLAAYRLARNKMSHKQAMEDAIRVTYESHFDYSSANKARWMQNDIAKMALVFRQYSLNMTYFMARNFQQSIQGETKAVKRLARRKLVGVLGMHSLFVGASGMPLYWLVASTVEAVMDDDDEPWDFTTEFRNFLTDEFGSKASEAIMVGGFQAFTGIGVHGRLSLNELWIREPYKDLEMQKAVEYYFLQLGFGALGGIATSIGRGYDLIQKGHVWRGVEAMSPKIIRDGLKAIRYHKEGVQNLNGAQVIDDLPLFAEIMQGVGFSSGEVSKQYDINSAIKKYENKASRRRQLLLGRFALALRVGDKDMHRKTLKEINKFNTKNPSSKIDYKSLLRSVGMRNKRRGQMRGGIYLNKKKNHLRNEVRF